MLTRALTVALAAPAAVLGVEACSGELVTTTADGGELDASTDVGSSDAESCAPVVLEVIDGSTDSGCPYTSEIEREPCGAPSNVTVYSDCYFRLDDCSRVCPGNLYFACHYVSPNCDGGIVDDGSTGNSTDTLVECLTSPAVCGTGRKPDGLLPTHHRGRVSHVGAWLAAAAHLEAASVHAFRILERELAELGAPDDLLLAAERARKDEIRHTKTAARLAKAHGGAPARARDPREILDPLRGIGQNSASRCV